jgi:outer membrane protein OmpA-like peptidoglycan-associated protein
MSAAFATAEEKPSPTSRSFGKERRMADTFVKDRLGEKDRRRADQIHLHAEKRWSAGPLIGLGVVALGLYALWGFARSKPHPNLSINCGQTTVQFDTNRVELRSDQKSDLTKLAACLRANPAQRVTLQGRAEPGELTYDSTLARGRADVLAEQLGALGVPANQLVIEANSTPCAEPGGECRAAIAIPQARRQ